MNISLDGVADHRVAIADDELHRFAVDMLDDLDIAMFGRVTYQLMESYRPHARTDPEATGSMIEFAEKFNAIPKIIFSQTLQKAGWNNTRLVRENAVEEIIRLKQQPGKNLSIGGIRISRDLMRTGVIDEYRLLVQPFIWGKGLRLFEGLEDRINLKLADTKPFKSGVVVLHYFSGNLK